MATLDQLFNPESIAVVGATPKEGKVGNTLFKNILPHQEQAKGKPSAQIYAVNAKYEAILGLKCYPTQ